METATNATVGNSVEDINLYIQAAKTLAYQKDEFLGLAVLSLETVFTNSVELVSVDNKWRIYFNPETIFTPKVKSLADLIKSETIKCLRNEATGLVSNVNFDGEGEVSLERQNNIRRYWALSIINNSKNANENDLKWANGFLAPQLPLSILEADYLKNRNELELLTWTSPEVITEAETMLANIDTLVYPENREKFLTLGLVSVLKSIKGQSDYQDVILKKAFEATLGSSEFDLIAFIGFRVMRYRRSPNTWFNKLSLQQLFPLFKLIGFLS